MRTIVAMVTVTVVMVTVVTTVTVVTMIRMTLPLILITGTGITAPGLLTHGIINEGAGHTRLNQEVILPVQHLLNPVVGEAGGRDVAGARSATNPTWTVASPGP